MNYFKKCMQALFIIIAISSAGCKELTTVAKVMI